MHGSVSMPPLDLRVFPGAIRNASCSTISSSAFDQMRSCCSPPLDRACTAAAVPVGAAAAASASKSDPSP